MDRGAVTPPLVAGPLRLAPFRAIRLAPTRVGDPASARLFSRPYRDAPDRMAQWERRGFLQHDDRPALWLHEYTASGMTVRGLVGALDLSHRTARPEERVVLPHEGVYPAQADDLADRMEALALNPAPILLVHRAPAAVRDLLHRVRAGTPAAAFTDRAGQGHRLWRLDDPEALAIVDDHLAPTRALIADGHHRYAAYLRLQQRNPGSAADRGLAMLIDREDTDLFLGAIHRVLVGSSVEDVEAAAAAVGMSVERASHVDAVGALAPGAMVASDGDRWLVIRPEPGTGEELMVTVLHDQLVPALGRGPTRVTYHHAVHDALALAQPGQATALLMPAATIDQVERIVLANRLMPEKATSFQPKPSAGTLLRSLRDEGFDPAAPRSRSATPRRRRPDRTGGARNR